VRIAGSRTIALVLVGLALGVARRAQAESGEISILVLKEHGVGSPTLAQPYVDRFVTLAAKENGWETARGQYLSSRTAAESFVKANGPHYGILSLPAFLALREPYRLQVLGRVASALAGGEQYFVVSKTAPDLAGCKGETLASDHTDDAKFVERVVARSAFKLSDFTVLQNQRPLQSVKQVLTGEAVCALIDDAQLAELNHLEGADTVRVVWSSKKLPPMAVVAFPAAPAPERKTFREKLGDVCADEGQTVCAEVGIHALEAAGANDYAEVVSAYGR
jgi:hypothetical protein